MATEAERLFSTYMQSHAERYAKFREEAYKEFQNEQKTAQEYRDELAAREKAYIKGIEALKKAQAGGLTDLEALRLSKELEALKIESQEEARRQRLSIEAEARKDLTITEAAQRKLDERGQALATSGSLITDPAGIEAFFNASVGDVAASVRGGTRNAASTGQSLYKQISSSPQFAKLTTAQRQNLRNSIVNSFGLAQVNIGGIAGEDLLDAPQDVLLQKEVDDLLAKEGGAYGVGKLNALQKKLDDLQDPTKRAAAKAATEEELQPLQKQLETIQAELEKAPKAAFPSEAAVRQRAAEKYGFESAKFLKSQFERDMLGSDQDKLLHYDAIQAAKSAPYKSSDDIYRTAKMYSDNLKDKLGGSKADKRKAIIEKAAEYGGGDPNKRDEFLIAFHQVELDKIKGRSGTSDVLPEPPVEPLKAPPTAPIPDTGRTDFQRRPAELEPSPGGEELQKAEQAALGSPVPGRIKGSQTGYYEMGQPSLGELFRNELDIGTRVGGAPITPAGGRDTFELRPAGRFEKFATKYMTDAQKVALMLNADPDVFDLVSGTLNRKATPDEIIQAQVIQATAGDEKFLEMKRKKEEERIINEAADRIEQRRREANK
jgi:hypothetical protein